LNNVVMAETLHTSLGYWQANRPEGAFPLFKGALLDSMYLGLCPGNVGMCTYFDADRHEAQRDFGDGCGTLSRALVEGLFGLKPDLLAGEIKIRPGFPIAWDHARLRHPDFQFQFQRDGGRETYSFTHHFNRPLKLILDVPALRDHLASVEINGHPAVGTVLNNQVGRPLVEIICPPAREFSVSLCWQGNPPEASLPAATPAVPAGAIFRADFPGRELLAVNDPQGALSQIRATAHALTGNATGVPGQRTVFAQLRQGALVWWQPVPFEIQKIEPATDSVDWNRPLVGRFESVDLSSTFNDRVTQIFKNNYLSPRSPFCSLATPQHGFGSWCHPKDLFTVNDAGLRALAQKGGGKISLPNGVPLATPGGPADRNIAFVSQWDNYPRQISVPLSGNSSRAFLLVAGSTTALQSRFENGEIAVTYTDGSVARLPLTNPTTWWPIDQDYYFDDFAFRQNLPGKPEVALPLRVDLATGKIRVLRLDSFKGKGHTVPGGAATVLSLSLDPGKELKSLELRAIANEVVLGLMSLTLQR
jgi:hypothetical protein